MPEPGLRTVLFDVDDTLVDFAGAARAALAEVVVAALSDPASTPGAGAGANQDLVAAAQRAWQQVSEQEYSRFTAGELNFDQMRLSRMWRSCARSTGRGPGGWITS